MQVSSSDVLTVGNLLQIIGAVLLALLSYIGVEIRRDVRAMSQKVTILWDRSERALADKSTQWDGKTERRHTE